jgi:hypothetical protein
LKKKLNSSKILGSESRGRTVHSLRHLPGQGWDQRRPEDGSQRGPVVHRQAKGRVRQRGEAVPQNGGKNGGAIGRELLLRV